jgi:hypothetical protein
VKGQDRHPAARRQALRQQPQERIERGEFVVHRNAQGLERTARGHFDVGLRQTWQRRVETGAQQALQSMGGVEGLLLEKTGDEMRVRFIGVFLEQAREILFARTRDELRRRLTAQRIHPHVERTNAFVTEAAIGIVELHRRHA